MAVSVQIAKFKLRQYQQRAISPNSMFTKVTCYVVGIWWFHQGRLHQTCGIATRAGGENGEKFS